MPYAFVCSYFLLCFAGVRGGRTRVGEWCSRIGGGFGGGGGGGSHWIGNDELNGWIDGRSIGRFNGRINGWRVRGLALGLSSREASKRVASTHRAIASLCK